MIRVEHGDCREVILAILDCSVDSCVTDPPYSLVSIQKRFGKPGSAPAKHGTDGLYRRASSGFMGASWDTGEVAHDPAWWAEVYRVLKPGAHLVAFGGTRTYHRMVCAIEDAGFEIRDMCAWTYGSGFPKSHDVSKSIDKAAGAKRLIIGHQHQHDIRHHAGDWNNYGEGLSASQREGSARYADLPITAPSTEAAQHWAGWGTALKPALEPIVLARKPLSEPTIAANVLKWGTGALNIDACRIDGAGRPLRELDAKETDNTVYSGRVNGGHGFSGGSKAVGTTDIGRWPANLLHDNSDEVLAAFPASAGQQGDVRGTEPSATGDNGIYGHYDRVSFNKRGSEDSAARRYTEEGSTDFAMLPGARRTDAGSAARFFFSAKADKHDRWGSKHPTVKPVDLIRWLARLVTPPGGTILDPFAGSGPLGVAALAEGFNAILIERELAYYEDIKERLAFYEGTGRHSMAAKNRSRKAAPGTLL